MQFLAFLIIAWSLLAAPGQAAYLLVPPDAQEILNVLGPDAHGLQLKADALPDLFALTASRLEEDPKIFLVEEPYLEGHWKGGKAVIEFARDLSYTQVSIYDKYGRRQRIYAVRSRLAEQKEKDEKKEEEALLIQKKNAFSGVPTDTDTEEEDQPRRRHPVKPTPAELEFEETASEPEQKTAAPPANTTVVQAPAVAAPVIVPVPVKTAPVAAPAVIAPPAKPPVLQAPAVAAPPVTLDIDETTVEAGPHYEWDEARGAYVPVNVKVVAQATPTAAPKVTVTAAPLPSPSVTPAPLPAAPVVKKKVPAVAVAAPPLDLHPAPETTGEWASLNAELDKRDKKSDVPPYQQPTQMTPPTQTTASGAPAESNAVYSKAIVPPVVQSPPKSNAAQISNEDNTGSRDVQAPPVQVVLPSSDAYDLPADEKTASPAVQDSALAAATASLAHQPAGKQTLASDDWVPSNAKPTPEEAIAVQETKKAAPDTSIDGLMKVASLNEGAVPNEANQWVPTPTQLPAPDADIHDELTRLHAEKKNTVAPVAKINRDINNPEEGVLPVNSFEKSSGSRYGRHREYERRIFFSKKIKSSVPPKSYDFYVDETDRRKETHNVYYYAHAANGKPPRLVAVERHTRVTFLSDYDVDKEDKGKVSTY